MSEWDDPEAQVGDDFGLTGAEIKSREPSFAEKLMNALQGAGHEFNSGLGAMIGMARTRSLPKHLPGGQMLFTGGDPNQPPQAMGDTLIAPSEAALTPRTLAHEGRHRGQSKDDGWSYLAKSLMGGAYGPYEEEAYGAEPKYEGPPPEFREVRPGLTVLDNEWARKNPDFEDYRSTQQMLDLIRSGGPARGKGAL